MNKSTITITVNDDQVTELVAYLISKNIKGFTVVDTVAGVERAQAAQAKATEPKTEAPAEKPAKVTNEDKVKAQKPGTSVKNSDGSRTGFILEDGKVVGKRFNPDTHRMYNCLAQSHLMDDEGKKVACKLHAIGSTDHETEMRYLDMKLMFKSCFDADMISKITEEDINNFKAELEAKTAKRAEMDAKREEAMNKAKSTTDDSMPEGYPTEK